MPLAANLRCRTMFNHVLKSVTDIGNFYLGVIVGYAEKLRLGAFDAFMLRPDSSDLNMVLSLLESDQIAPYNICVRQVLARNEVPRVEIWVSLASFPLDERIDDWNNEPINSPKWHKKRGLLLGIPETQINENYHISHS